MRRGRLAVAVAVALLAVACSGGSSHPASSTTAAARSTTTLSAAPRRGGVLRLGMVRPATLDPAAATPTVLGETVVADLLFDSLTAMPAGATTAQASVASSWKASADLKTWTFALDPNAKFANGRTINAGDVKYSLERVAKKGESSLAGVRLEVITGYAALLFGAPGLAGLKIVNSETLEVDLSTPLAVLPELLSNPLYGIVPREAVEAKSPAFASAPVGSGPFRFQRAEGDVVHLVSSGSDRTLLDGIDLHYYDTDAGAYAAFTHGDVDWAPVPDDRLAEVRSRYGTAGFVPYTAELFYAFNLASPKFADVRFRQAIVRAIDSGEIARAVYGGRADALAAVVPAGVPGHRDLPCASCTFDPPASRALLAAAFPFGPATIPAINLDYSSGTTQDAVAHLIAADLAAVGIKATLRAHPFAEYQTFATSGQQELFEFGWVGAYPSPDAYLGPLFLSGSRDNAAALRDGAVDLRLAVARAEADPTRRLADYAAVEDTVLADAAIVPLIQFESDTVYGPDVRGLRLTVGGSFGGETVWLAR